MIAGSILLDVLITELARVRPVFHSEADLQQALAWQAHLLDPKVEVRLETRPDPLVREQLDLLLYRPDLDRSTAIEVKYWKKRWSGTVNGELFDLPDQNAQDVRHYDFLKDIARVERWVAERSGWDGLVLAWSNDHLDWSAAAHSAATGADDFRLHDGVVLAGVRAWGPQAGPGTRKGREEPIALSGSYELAWDDFSNFHPGSGGQMRLLAVEVPEVV